MASNVVTTSGSSNTSSNQDLTIDVECNEIDNNYVVVPNHTNPANLQVNRRNSDNGSAIRLCLQEEELWHEFYAVGNEMIVTKPGRRMYPYVVVTPYDMKAGVQYVVVLRIVPVDNKRYKYTNGMWHAVSGSDATVDVTRMSFKHPTTPALGEHLNGKPLIFKHAKLTHVRENKEHILVRTMHKYMAVIDISVVGENVMRTTTFVFMETTFIAVTSYLSSQLTSLKIRHNPFARGIQDRAQLSITNGDSDYTDEDDDILPPIISGNPHSSLLTRSMALPPPFLPLLPLTSQQGSELNTQISVPQIFSYTSASSYSQVTSCVSAPSLPPQESSCVSASNYVSTFTLPPRVPVPGFPFYAPAVSGLPQPDSNTGSPTVSTLTQDSSLVSRLPRWPAHIPSTSSSSFSPITSYFTTPSGRHHLHSHVSWPYPHPIAVQPQPLTHRLPSTESFKMTTPMPSFPHLHYPTGAATPYYPNTTIPYPVYYNTRYRPNLQ